MSNIFEDLGKNTPLKEYIPPPLIFGDRSITRRKRRGYEIKSREIGRIMVTLKVGLAGVCSVRVYDLWATTKSGAPRLGPVLIAPGLSRGEAEHLYELVVEEARKRPSG